MQVVRCLQKLSASCNFFVGVFGDTYNGVDRTVDQAEEPEKGRST